MSKFQKVYPQSDSKIVFMRCNDRQSLATFSQRKKNYPFSHNIALDLRIFKMWQLRKKNENKPEFKKPLLRWRLH